MDNTLIRRQAAIGAIMLKPAWHGSDGSYYHAADIRKAVNDLPSEQPFEEIKRRIRELIGIAQSAQYENQDFITGYVAAMMVVKGMIAEVEGEQQ